MNPNGKDAILVIDDAPIPIPIPRTRRGQDEMKLTRPGVTFSKEQRPGAAPGDYSEPLKNSGTWRTIVTDRNNPALGLEVTIEMIDGSLHVTINHAGGHDRSVSRRNVPIG